MSMSLQTLPEKEAKTRSSQSRSRASSVSHAAARTRDQDATAASTQQVLVPHSRGSRMRDLSSDHIKYAFGLKESNPDDFLPAFKVRQGSKGRRREAYDMHQGGSQMKDVFRSPGCGRSTSPRAGGSGAATPAASMLSKESLPAGGGGSRSSTPLQRRKSSRRLNAHRHVSMQSSAFPLERSSSVGVVNPDFTVEFRVTMSKNSVADLGDVDVANFAPADLATVPNSRVTGTAMEQNLLPGGRTTPSPTSPGGPPRSSLSSPTKEQQLEILNKLPKRNIGDDVKWTMRTDEVQRKQIRWTADKELDYAMGFSLRKLDETEEGNNSMTRLENRPFKQFLNVKQDVVKRDLQAEIEREKRQPQMAMSRTNMLVNSKQRSSTALSYDANGASTQQPSQSAPVTPRKNSNGGQDQEINQQQTSTFGAEFGAAKSSASVVRDLYNSRRSCVTPKVNTRKSRADLWKPFLPTSTTAASTAGSGTITGLTPAEGAAAKRSASYTTSTAVAATSVVEHQKDGSTHMQATSPRAAAALEDADLLKATPRRQLSLQTVVQNLHTAVRSASARKRPLTTKTVKPKNLPNFTVNDHYRQAGPFSSSYRAAFGVPRLDVLGRGQEGGGVKQGAIYFTPRGGLSSSCTPGNIIHDNNSTISARARRALQEDLLLQDEKVVGPPAGRIGGSRDLHRGYYNSEQPMNLCDWGVPKQLLNSLLASSSAAGTDKDNSNISRPASARNSNTGKNIIAGTAADANNNTSALSTPRTTSPRTQNKAILKTASELLGQEARAEQRRKLSARQKAARALQGYSDINGEEDVSEVALCKTSNKRDKIFRSPPNFKDEVAENLYKFQHHETPSESLHEFYSGVPTTPTSALIVKQRAESAPPVNLVENNDEKTRSDLVGVVPERGHGQPQQSTERLEDEQRKNDIKRLKVLHKRHHAHLHQVGGNSYHYMRKGKNNNLNFKHPLITPYAPTKELTPRWDRDNQNRVFVPYRNVLPAGERLPSSPKFKDKTVVGTAHGKQILVSSQIRRVPAEPIRTPRTVFTPRREEDVAKDAQKVATRERLVLTRSRFVHTPRISDKQEEERKEFFAKLLKNKESDLIARKKTRRVALAHLPGLSGVTETSHKAYAEMIAKEK
ncbi:unnamed protein product [Amoebophrya sp. A120]|nr:unnamed protein product [Amoebophrya sp. A120]|eukprot:GSA120T00017005001.1